MKRVISIMGILCVLFLAGCSHDASVGIIGGADGPTSIIVGRETDNMKKPIRMIKVGGKLYYDSGQISDTAYRCGTLDGELRQTVEEYEIPQNDNECNFEGADGYQNVTGITKEIPIDGQWVIFKLFDDPELDMNVFKYCFYLKGALPNAARDSEIVVLTEDIDYSFEDYAEILSSQLNPAEKHYKTTFTAYGSNDKWGISLQAKDVTNTGLTIMCEQFCGNETGALQTGEWFLLEGVKDNEWKMLETNPLIDYVWNSAAYIIKKNDITEFKVDWKWLYGELEPGYYRLKKEIMDFRTAGDFDKELYEVYFTVE